MFALSRNEGKELRQQYYDDPLFCLVSPLLKGVTVGNKFKHITVVYIWKTALELCQELGRCPRPEHNTIMNSVTYILYYGLHARV